MGLFIFGPRRAIAYTNLSSVISVVLFCHNAGYCSFHSCKYSYFTASILPSEYKQITQEIIYVIPE